MRTIWLYGLLVHGQGLNFILKINISLLITLLGYSVHHTTDIKESSFLSDSARLSSLEQYPTEVMMHMYHCSKSTLDFLLLIEHVEASLTFTIKCSNWIKHYESRVSARKCLESGKRPLLSQANWAPAHHKNVITMNTFSLPLMWCKAGIQY